MEDHCLYSSEPPRHRIYTKQTASTASSESTTQPWTATRCHRLLRPLLAHIAALRKEKERRELVRNASGSTTSAQPANPRGTVLGKRSYPGSDSDYSEKKTYRKYSRKAAGRLPSSQPSCTPQRNTQRQRRQPGNRGPQDVVLPTPFLRRLRNHQQSSPIRCPDEPCQEEAAPASGRCNHVGSGCRTKCAFEIELAGLRSVIDAERHGLYESVFKAFDSLLRVASPQKNNAAGSKSLVAMCLRKVPAYIAGLEAWKREESEENGTKSAVQGAGVSFELYSELETLGAAGGWRHLCLLVRAHAVQVIEDAAVEGLLEDSVTDLLIRVCFEYMPPMEFMGLLNSYIVRQYPRPRSPDDDWLDTAALRPLRILRTCDPSGTSLLPDMLSVLLDGGLLPADWILTTSFIGLWPTTVQHITKMKSCQDTLSFVVTTLELLSDLASPRRPRGVPQTRIRGKPQTTLISAVAALGSVILLSEEGSKQNSGDSATSRSATLARRLESVVTTCTARLKRRKKGGRKLGTYLLALCLFLSLDIDPASTSTSAETLETFWKGVQNCRGDAGLMLQYDATTALMSAMAHNCGRGTGLAPHVHLSQLCDKLETLHLPRGAASGMRVDGAFRLAEHTGDLRDLAYAEALRARMAAACATPEQSRSSGSGSGSGSKQKRVSSFSGIRWDDGISEWVAATPATEPRAAWGRGTRSRSRSKSRGPVERERDVSSGSASETEASLDGANPPASPQAYHDHEDIDSDSSAASGSDIEDETLSPQVASSPSTPPESEVQPEPDLKPPRPDGDDDADDDSQDDGDVDEDEEEYDEENEDETRNANQPTSPPSASSLPPSGNNRRLLTARPRRLRLLALSRPQRATRSAGAGDELAFDDGPTVASVSASASVSVPAKETWLGGKKPARFSRAAVAAAGAYNNDNDKSAEPAMLPPPVGITMPDKQKAGKGRRKVARASLVYQEQRRRRVQTVGMSTTGGGGGGGGGGGVEYESDDELSIL